MNKPKVHNIYDDLANQISDYVQKRIDQPIVIDDLAEATGFSKYHLNRLFHAKTGFQLGEFVQRRKLQKAYALLASGECSVIDVGVAVGYESHSSFSRAFLKVFGCSPSSINKNSHVPLPKRKKSNATRNETIQPALIQKSHQTLLGLYGSGFDNNSYQKLAGQLFNDIYKRLAHKKINASNIIHVGISLESPWYGEQESSRFFAGLLMDQQDNIELEQYEWVAGQWVKFIHKGSYELMWQSISRIYSGWIIPEGILLSDSAIVQTYLNNPENTPSHLLETELYFPIAS